MVTEQKAARPMVVTGLELAIGDRIERVQLLESCSGVWLFDIRHRRFCRVLPGQGPPPAGDWSHYYELEVDPERGCFSITVDPMGSSVLRSWFHVGECRFCSIQQLQTEPERGPVDREEAQ